MFKGHLPKDVRHGQPNPVGLALKGRKRHQNDYLHISDEMSGDGVACLDGSTASTKLQRRNVFG